MEGEEVGSPLMEESVCVFVCVWGGEGLSHLLRSITVFKSTGKKNVSWLEKGAHFRNFKL